MKKLDTIEKLAKAIGGLSEHFKKAAEHHEKLHKAHLAKAEHHKSLHEVHKAHQAFVKAKHESMDDGDVHKTYFGKCADMHAAKAEHHESLHKVHSEIAEAHKAHADHLNELASATDGEEKNAAAGNGASKDKAAGAPGSTVESMMSSTVDALVQKALAELDSNETVKNKIQEVVLTRVNEALGSKIVPDHVRGAMPSDGLRLVQRGNGADAPTPPVTNIPAELIEAFDE